MSLKNVSLKQIASELNISVNTVSHALRDFSDISDETKAKVRKKAIELGYMPNHVAQKMRKDEEPLVAIVIDSLSNLYFNTFINELVNLFQQKDEYDFLLLYAKTLNTNVIKQCILQRADLLITHMHFDEDVYEFAKLNDIRIIFVGSRLNNTEIDNVSIDNFAGCVLAARHLESIKDGNDKYLYVGIDYFLSAHRYSIFKTELKQTNKDALIAKFNSDRESISVLYSYVKEGYRKIFFYNDMLGYEIFDQLEKYAPDFRKDFPDLRIIGFDGLSTYVCGLEDIDSIEIDFSKFAKSTYDIMKNRIEQPKSETQNVVLPVSLHLKK